MSPWWLVAAIAYVGVCAGCVYADATVVLWPAGLVAPLLGRVLARWWALVAPAFVVLLVVPYGYGDDPNGHEAPVWVYLAGWWAVPTTILLAIGVGLAKLAARRRGAVVASRE